MTYFPRRNNESIFPLMIAAKTFVYKSKVIYIIYLRLTLQAFKGKKLLIAKCDINDLHFI